MNAIDREKLLKWLKSLDSTYVTKEIIPQIESGAFDIKPPEYSGENKNSKTESVQICTEGEIRMELTREIVLAEPPGKRLDSWIAEKVMGWKTNRKKTDWWEEINPNTHRHKGSVKDFKPSTDIASVWEVEEEIERQNKRVAYCQALKIVLYSKDEYVGMFDYVHASPADRCKAALLAVMENG